MCACLVNNLDPLLLGADNGDGDEDDHVVMVMFAMVVRMIVLLLTLFYLVPTISTERAKTIIKIPWAPIPVTSL